MNELNNNLIFDTNYTNYFSAYEDRWKIKVEKKLGKELVRANDESWEDLYVKIRKAIKEDKNPFAKAIELNCEKLVLKLIEKDPLIINQKINYLSVLDHAICKGSLEIVRSLIEKNVERSVFSLICASNKLDIFKLLIDKGFKVSTIEMHTLLVNERFEAAHYVLDHGQFDLKDPNASIIHQVAQGKGKEQTRILKWLLDHGADVNLTSKQGVTALHLISAQQNEESKQLLLMYGADTSLKDCYGYQAQDWWNAKEDLVRSHDIQEGDRLADEYNTSIKQDLSRMHFAMKCVSYVGFGNTMKIVNAVQKIREWTQAYWPFGKE